MIPASFRLGQRSFGRSKWHPGPVVTDDEGWARGLMLLGHARDMSELSEPERARLIHLLQMPSLDDDQDAELAALLTRCTYYGPQCFDDIDSNTESALWDNHTVEEHKATALRYARARDAAWRELGIVLRWWSSNDKGGLHGDVPPVPDTLKSPHLPRAWQRLGWLVNDRASQIMGGPLPIGSRLQRRRKAQKPPIYLDDSNHNRYRDARGSVWRIGFAAKPEPGKHRVPIDISTGRLLSTDSLPVMPQSDWARALPLLTSFIARIELEEAPKPKRTPKPKTEVVGAWEFELPKPRVMVALTQAPAIVASDPDALQIWDMPKHPGKIDRSFRDWSFAKRLITIGVEDEDIANLLESMPGSKCGERGHKYTDQTIKSAHKAINSPRTSAWANTALSVALTVGMAITSPFTSAFATTGPFDDVFLAQELQAAREDMLERQAILEENVQQLATEAPARPGLVAAKLRASEQKLRNLAREIAWASLHDATLSEREKKTLERYAECYLRGIGRKCNGVKKNGKPCTHISCRPFRCHRDACPFCVTSNHKNLNGALLAKLAAEDTALREKYPDAQIAAWYVEVESPPDPVGFKTNAKRLKDMLRGLDRGRTRTYYGPLTVFATCDNITAAELARVTGKTAVRVNSLTELAAPVSRVISRRFARIAEAIKSYGAALEATGHRLARVGEATVVDPVVLSQLRKHEFRQWLGHVNTSTAGKAAKNLPWPSAPEVTKFAQEEAKRFREEQGITGGPDDCQDDPEHAGLHLGEWGAWTFGLDGSKGVFTILKIQPGVGKRPKRSDVLATAPMRC